MNAIFVRLVGRRLVITAHDVESFVSSLEVPLLSRIAYRLAHRVIAHNNISRDELVRCLKLPLKKIEVVPHGNYFHALQPKLNVNVARNKIGIPLDAKVLLFFGQIKDVKGLDLLLDAMPLVLNRHSNMILLISGKPWKTDFSAYQTKIDELGIGGACVTDIRYIPDDEISLYYGAADLVVLPYRHIYQSGVVLMAMSYAKAVLVSNIAGMLEVVRDGDTGFVFDLKKENDLANIINKIFDNPTTICEVAQRGFELMGENYDWGVIGQKTKEVYLAVA